MTRPMKVSSGIDRASGRGTRPARPLHRVTEMTAIDLTADAWTEDSTLAAEDPRTYVTFVLADQILGVDVAMVRRILDMQPVTRLPNAPMDLLGMIDISGDTIALTDLPGRLGLRGDETGANRRIIVLELGSDPVTTLGFIADRVLGVVEIPEAEIDAPPSAMSSWDASVLKGVARVNGALTQILALEALFGTSHRDAFDFA